MRALFFNRYHGERNRRVKRFQQRRVRLRVQAKGRVSPVVGFRDCERVGEDAAKYFAVEGRAPFRLARLVCLVVM